MNFLERVEVIDNKAAGSDHFILKVRSDLLKNGKNLPKEGQFYMLEVVDKTKILKRPISLHSANEKTGELEFFIKVLGEGTASLAELEKGESFELQGPLGQGFFMEELGGHVCIVGGGIGLAPFKAVIEKLSGKDEIQKITFIAAGRNKEILELTAGFGLKNKSKVETVFCTDDGSVGFHGHAVSALEDHFKNREKPNFILSCGPVIMLEGINSYAKKHEIMAQISLEARMACGVGACMGCVVDTIDGKKRVCKDGPVFLGTELI